MTPTHRGRPAAAKRTATLVLAAGVLLTACETNAGSAPRFPAGTTMDKIQRAGAITVGVKVDQPGFGFLNLATGKLEGFDIRIAELIAAGLGLAPSQIHYVEAVSSQRQALLRKGQVNIVVATYSINQERQQQVGQAGPYFTTGQRLLVRTEDKDKIKGPRDLTDKKVCSAEGSTSYRRIIHDYATAGVEAVEYYTQCVQKLLGKNVDAVTTDGAILSVYAAQQPDELVVVGRPFSTEQYGIGYPKGDLAFCEYITQILRQAIHDGSWDRAFRDTLGKAGVPPTQPPEPKPCQP